MTKQYLDSYVSASDIELLLRQNWCEVCQAADTGVTDPKIYIEDGKKFFEGKCNVCGSTNISIIEVKQV